VLRQRTRCNDNNSNEARDQASDNSFQVTHQGQPLLLNGLNHTVRRKRSRSSGRRRLKLLAANASRLNSVLLPIEEKDELSLSSWSIDRNLNCAPDAEPNDSASGAKTISSEASNSEIKVRIDWTACENNQLIYEINELKLKEHESGEVLHKKASKCRLKKEIHQERRSIQTDHRRLIL
jgi:hypothetical protein